jgi:hypothetical protein
MSYPGLGVGCVLPKAVREALGIKEGEVYSEVLYITLNLKFI